MPEPKIVAVLKGGVKIYWCPAVERQLPEAVCKQRYFSKSGKRARACRLCLGLNEGKHWPEPWNSIREGK